MVLIEGWQVPRMDNAPVRMRTTSSSSLAWDRRATFKLKAKGKVRLPAGDNPGQQVVINGEVEQDKTDDMGPANEPADWRSPLVHAGTWVPWNNKNVTAGNLPYCNYDLSIGTSYEFQNLGPIASGGSC